MWQATHPATAKPLGVKKLIAAAAALVSLGAVVPIAATAAAPCAPDAPLVTDPKGDATVLAAVDTGRNEPTLDVTRVDVTGDPAKQELVVTFRFANLTEANPSGAVGMAVDGSLKVGGRITDVTAGRGLLGPFFVANGESVTGSFDPAKDTVTVRVPRAVLGVYGVHAVTELTAGYTRRGYDPTPLGPIADSFSGTCARQVDVGGAPPKADAVVGPGAPFSWTGKHATAVSDPAGVGASITFEGRYEDVRRVQVNEPGRTLVFTTTCTVGPDYDIRLSGPGGAPIGTGLTDTEPGYSATGDCAEKITVANAPAGVYEATVIAFTTVHSTYTGTIKVS